MHVPYHCVNVLFFKLFQKFVGRSKFGNNKTKLILLGQIVLTLFSCNFRLCPTTFTLEADPATIKDGGRRNLCIDSMPSQRLLVVSPLH